MSHDGGSQFATRNSRLGQTLAIIVLIVLGLVGALTTAARRIAVERANHTVGVCLDNLEVRQLAALTGIQPLDLLRQFRQLGVTHLAVSEQTLGGLMQTGQVSVVPTSSSQATITETYSGHPVHPGLREGLAKIPGAKILPPASRQLTPGLSAALKAGNYPRQAVAVAPRITDTMLNLGVGYDPTTITQARQAGLRIVARPFPDYLDTPQAVEVSLTMARREAHADVVIFNGVAVDGGAKLAKSTAATLQRLGLQYGYLEMVPQDGDTALATALKYRVIRTHSISQEEMAKTSAQRGHDRFMLAVQERNVRLCYVRLLLNPQPDLLAANLAYVKSLTDGIRNAGFALGSPYPFAPLALPKAALILLSLGLVGGALWLLQLVLCFSPRWFWGLLVVGLAFSLAAPVVVFGPWRVVVSLLCAIIFPTLGILVAARSAGQPAASCGAGGPCCPWVAILTADPGAQPGLRAVGLTLRAALISVIGGLLIAATLSSSDYMMEIAKFRGVKLAELLPLVLVLVVTLASTMEAYRQTEGGWPALREGLKQATDQVVRYWQAIAIMVVLGAVVFMIMRSGNQSAIAVSGLELKLRALLDRILVVRPRTKEIAVGYPALMMGLALLLHRRPRSAWVWLTIGAIGQISVIDTFCHIHTPLPISLLRVFNGFWVGIVVGLVGWALKWLGERILAAIWWKDSQ